MLLMMYYNYVLGNGWLVDHVDCLMQGIVGIRGYVLRRVETQPSTTNHQPDTDVS